ncbi:hypothetical protein KP509_02G068200 [Ceratopteris richardii]|uniref:Uncharacterized protein n=1 Tax=Ceratopteris richardii TaxID=49495 RepID=A0A8T2VAC4_CERRI|nr:hypothetical protein KP509_02G068200 [Ceratopteris richardii]
MCKLLLAQVPCRVWPFHLAVVLFIKIHQIVTLLLQEEHTHGVLGSSAIFKLCNGGISQNDGSSEIFTCEIDGGVAIALTESTITDGQNADDPNICSVSSCSDNVLHYLMDFYEEQIFFSARRLHPDFCYQICIIIWFLGKVCPIIPRLFSPLFHFIDLPAT